MLEGREFAEDADERLVGQLEVARHICLAIRGSQGHAVSSSFERVVCVRARACVRVRVRACGTECVEVGAEAEQREGLVGQVDALGQRHRPQRAPTGGIGQEKAQLFVAQAFASAQVQLFGLCRLYPTI